MGNFFKEIIYHTAISGKSNLAALKRKIYQFRVRHNVYRKVDLPEYDESLLEKKYPYRNPCCVSKKYFFQHRVAEYDVSLIVPLYNSVRYAKRIVDMFNQQKTNYTFEVILVNDGSKDDTYNVVQKLISDKDHFALYDKENGGIADARNYGIERCRGKYIGFVDHDDIVTDDYIQKLCSLAEKENADVVMCQHGTITVDGVITRKGLSGGFIWGGGLSKTHFRTYQIP